MARNMKSFFKEKKKEGKPNAFYAATQSLCGEDSKPLEWEIRALSTEDVDDIMDRCSYEVQVPGKPGQYRDKLDDVRFNRMLICKAVVFPDLDDSELQDSYGVKTPEALIVKMIDNRSEFNAFSEFVLDMSGLNKDKVGSKFNHEVETAKNS